MDSTNKPTLLTPPVAPKKPYTHEMHGHLRCDDYFWLRDDNRETAEILDYLHQENAYTQARMAPLAGLQSELYKEMVARQEPELESLPYFKKGFWYVSRFQQGKEFTVYTRRRGTMDAPEELLLDCNKRAEGQSYYQLGDLALPISNNFRRVPFGFD